MKEILKNTIHSLTYTIYVSGVATDATGNVTVSAVRDGVTVINAQTATRTAAGVYSYVLPVGATTTEGELTVTWSFTVAGSAMTVSEKYTVVTPYVDWSEFAATLYTYADFLEAESVVRFVINSHCGQTFGYRSGTVAVEGQGLDVLLLPEHIVSVTTVTYTDYSLVTSTEVVDMVERGVYEIAGGGWVLRQQPRPPRLNAVRQYDPRYRRNTVYNITGTWGYDGVPTAVQNAAKILVADYLCGDHKYRDKYLKTISMGDWRLAYYERAFVGTGNATADQLLEDYLAPSIGVV